MNTRRIFKIIIPVLTLIIPIALYLVQKKEKELSYEILSASSIVDVNSPIGRNIQVFFSGKKLNKLEAVSVRIVNSGNVPIKRTDFERELQLSFGEKANVLMQRISEAFPENLSVEATGYGEKVLVKPLLLNPSDQFTIETFIEGEKSKIKLDARIEGISQATRIDHSHALTSRRSILLVIGALLGFIIYLYMAFLLYDVFTMKSFKSKFTIMMRSEIIFILLASGFISALLGVQFYVNLSMSYSFFTVAIVCFAGVLIVIPLRLKLQSIKDKLIDDLGKNWHAPL